MRRLRKLRPDPRSLRDAREGVLRAFSLVVTDRRWAAPLSAMALGFGLFLGVAIGPGAAGSLATGAGSIVAFAPGEGEAEPEAAEAEAEPSGSGEAEEPTATTESLEPGVAEPALLPEPAPEALPEEAAPPSKEPTPEAGEGEGEAQELKGTVVHVNPAAGSYALAIAGGELVSIHAAKLPTPGEKLTVQAEPLDNSTFAEDEREKTGTSAQASARGVVTYIDDDPAAPAYTLSGRGSSILVQVPASPAPRLPALGAYATVGMKFEAAQPRQPPAVAAEPTAAGACAPDPALKPLPPPQKIVVQRTLKTEPEPATYVDMAGIVSAVCPATKQLLLSADDLRASEDDLLIAVPDAIGTAKLKIGESVVATATVEEGGSLTLAGLANDEGRQGAENTSLALGDLRR